MEGDVQALAEMLLGFFSTGVIDQANDSLQQAG
jgi:hypothetical protein